MFTRTGRRSDVHWTTVLVLLFAFGLFGQAMAASNSVNVQTFWDTPAGQQLVVPEGSMMYLAGQIPANAVVDKTTNTITFTTDRTTFLVGAGMETASSMMTFSVMGLVNPTLKIPAGSTVKVLFVNADEDMAHSFVVTTSGPPYPASPTLKNAPAVAAGAYTPNPIRGTQMENPEGVYHGNVIQFQAPKKEGTYWYACYFPGHALAGMYGKFVVTPAKEEE